MRKKLLVVSLIFFFYIIVVNAQLKDTSPNVILILADDMGIGDVSLINEGRTSTPAINKLANEGLWFDQAYSAAPVCAPARASLLTGQYPHRTGCVTLDMQLFPELSRMKKGLHTIANVFAENGYVTGLVGKWHCGIGEDYHPLKRGFQEYDPDEQHDVAEKNPDIYRELRVKLEQWCREVEFDRLTIIP